MSDDKEKDHYEKQVSRLMDAIAERDAEIAKLTSYHSGWEECMLMFVKHGRITIPVGEISQKKPVWFGELCRSVAAEIRDNLVYGLRG